MNTLTIKGMKFKAFHGVHEHEKTEGNNFEVDVIFYTDLFKAGSSDQLSDAIDYTKVYEIVSDIIHGESVDLIEHLCFKIGSEIESSSPDRTKFEVAVRKLNPPLSSQTSYTEARMSWPA